jgi:3-hydroxyanthranilate 3,4-dioxygenase
VSTSSPRGLRPLNLDRFIEDHRHLLKPPVGNKLIWEDGDMMAFVVGGPNRRTDYHDDPVEEFFFQIEGRMTLRLQHASGEPPEDVPIVTGEMFLLPPHIRHSPQREAGSVGLVIEPARPPEAVEAFEWYCPRCYALIHRAEVVVTKIDEDLPPIFAAFYRDEQARTCDACGAVHPTA